MLENNPSNVDPKLLAKEVKTMRPLVNKGLADNYKDIITYGKKQLVTLAKDKKIVEALAFIYCFEENTGYTLDIKELNTKNDDLLYSNDIRLLAETLDTLEPLIGIYFPPNN